jgi:hypothetical protein
MQLDPHRSLDAGKSSDIDLASEGSLPAAHASAAPLAGAVAFASPEAQLQRTAELLGDGALVVIVPPLPASARGRLGEHLDELVERELAARGAPSPYLCAWSAMPDDAEARLADQLFRARTVGASGIAIAMGSLARTATPALDVADCATLRALLLAAASAPLVVLLDDLDSRMDAYAAPMPLDAMLQLRRGEARAGERHPRGADAAPADATGRDEDRLARADTPDAAAPDEVQAPAETSSDAAAPDEFQAPAEALELVETHVDAPVAETPREDEREAAQRRATAGVPVAGPSDYWRAWAIALGAARGPQQLATFERLFTESYMPLANAIAGGVEDPRALRAHDEFQRGFSRSYSDAFATFGASGRRPRLVMDAYDVAAKQARIHNARTTHVLIVDAMRHDLGGLVRDAIAQRAPGAASLTSESVLWSALPTTTFRQLETLARGMDALQKPAPEEDVDSLRGRSAESVRRLRVGSRELYKLDVIPSMLGGLADPARGASAGHVVDALEPIADAVADAIVRHFQTLPPRTLLLVLGDHGFTIDRRGRISHGGATPEEVLVPCLSYLVGDLH